MKKILCAFICALPLSAFADGLSALNKFNDEVKTLSGDFTQTVKNAKKTQHTSGSFAFSRPDRFRWIYEQPYQQEIIGDGKIVWLYDKDLAQVTKKSQNNAVGASPAAILSDKKALQQHYNLKNDGEENGISYISATPKNNNSEYKIIRIGLKNEMLMSMRLLDNFGNITDIVLQNVKLNPELSGGLFQFKTPPGVDVLDADKQ